MFDQRQTTHTATKYLMDQLVIFFFFLIELHHRLSAIQRNLVDIVMLAQGYELSDLVRKISVRLRVMLLLFHLGLSIEQMREAICACKRILLVCEKDSL